MSPPHSPARLALWLALPLAAIVGLGWLAFARSGSRDTRDRLALTETAAATQPSADLDERVERFCGGCHAYPTPDTFPRDGWPAEVRRGFDFYGKSGLVLDAPRIEEVTAHYQDRAPSAFEPLPRTPDSERPPVAWRRREVVGPSSHDLPAIAFVGLAHLTGADTAKPDLLACDMVRGELLIRRAGDPEDAPLNRLADGLNHPAHAEVVDLDGDGVRDLIVADLGSPVPSDDLFGRVVWLRGRADGGFDLEPLAERLGRVCDVQAADFDGDGDLDLAVAVFGWHRAGEILLLEQRPGAPGRPEFVSQRLDDRHGTIHLPIADLDRDGRPDFVALISQEHEAVVAFLNAGSGRFRKRTLNQAPHPAYGSSGIQVVDLDGDGDLDVLRSNGDVYDSPLLKPYHGVSWLENRGDGPFEPHPIGPLYGAHRALAGDLDGDGDLDVVASSFLGEPYYGAARRDLDADSLVLFEQTAPGRWARHALERQSCDYPTIALGDVDADGDLDLVAGRFRDFHFSGARPPGPPPYNGPLVIWENLGPATGAPAE